eukprot:TRINITY_DN7177_c0_g1_i1.p1 TRINITY_DN7177_c0_g1~~TRINITY_DN7177_c0_g1_i1.p1  ORF type:complete len:244 (-),score=79.91 TRINITY_DN7177_c0_g1_i1:59-790(-)
MSETKPEEDELALDEELQYMLTRPPEPPPPTVVNKREADAAPDLEEFAPPMKKARRSSAACDATPRPKTAYRLFCDCWKSQFSEELRKLKRCPQELSDSGFTGNLTLAGYSRWIWDTLSGSDDKALELQRKLGTRDQYEEESNSSRQAYKLAVELDIKRQLKEAEEARLQRKAAKKVLLEEQERILLRSEEAWRDEKDAGTIHCALLVLYKCELARRRKIKKQEEKEKQMQMAACVAQMNLLV